MATREQIMKIVRTISQSEVEDKESHFSPLYKGFKKKYPILFDLACRSGQTMDIETLSFMLDMLDKVNNKETTQEDASVVVGQQVFNKFVDVSKLTPSSTSPMSQNFKIETHTSAS
jgi:hypothetical protein